MPKIKIYQINPERDKNNVIFMEHQSLSKYIGSDKVDSSIYDLVFDGNVPSDSLEDIYIMFNYKHPRDYIGRSMSVSDVVEIINSEGSEPKFFYCDNIGFSSISFEPEKCGRHVIYSKEPPKENKLQVVLVRTGKPPRRALIGQDLESMQKIVAGYIEAINPYRDGTALVCNEEAKIFGLPPNRAIYDENKNIVDIIFGDFFIVGSAPGSEEFSSLTSEQTKKYMEMFRYPEQFVKMKRGAFEVANDPKKDREAR